MESLQDKLRALGVNLGMPASTGVPKEKVTRIEQVVNGEYFPTSFGEAFIVREEIDPSKTFGLLIPSTLDLISQWANSTRLPTARFEEVIFLDTETSGLAGGTGTFAFMIGMGYFTDHSFQLIQLFMRDPSEEPGLLSALSHFLGNFKTIVTFNGKSFDIPLLNTRHVLNGFTTPFTEIDHVDLLHLARRLWRTRLPSRALKDLEIELLDIQRTQEEVPGWMVPELYYNYLRHGDVQPLSGVFYHNGMDVISLAALFNYTASLLDHPLQYQQVDSLDLVAIARLYDQLDRTDEALSLYEKALDQGLPITFYADTLLRFAEIKSRRGDLQAALSLWQKAAENGSVEGCLHLAKHYEHTVKAFFEAHRWAKKALVLLERSPDHSGKSIDDVQKRINRIEILINREVQNG